MVAQDVILSAKQFLIQSCGFAWSNDHEVRYTRYWHSHDCAMLLWPLTGSLKTVWGAIDAPHTATLTRTTALLLPEGVPHQTLSGTVLQGHGELYLDSRLLQSFGARFGALQLDGATVAMLDALLHPSLLPNSADKLVRTVLTQLSTAAKIEKERQPGLTSQLVKSFVDALEQEKGAASIDSLAAKMGISVRQLQRLCKKECGLSPIDLRRQVVARYARDLLSKEESLSNVSDRLGFANSGHLARLLREAESKTEVVQIFERAFRRYIATAENGLS